MAQRTGEKAIASGHNSGPRGAAFYSSKPALPTLDQIPTLTDEEFDRVYYEALCGLEWLPVYDGWMRHGELVTYRTPPFVCHPDCPASVLEGLPGMVERFTGVKVIITAKWPVAFEACRIEIAPDNTTRVPPRKRAEFNEDIADVIAYPRHLPHACIAAAVAACVVLGRKGEG